MPDGKGSDKAGADVCNLLDLVERQPALTKASGGYLAESAAVALHARGHGRSVKLVVSGSLRCRLHLLLPTVTDQMKRAYGDPDEAVEHGAYGIAILILARRTPFQVVRRSRKGTGFDYWLGKKSDDLLQSSGRLEVSGIGEGNAATVQRRLNEKTEQATKVDLPLTTFVVVVEYGHPQARTATP